MTSDTSLDILLQSKPRDAKVCHGTSARHFDEKNMAAALHYALKAIDLGHQARNPNPWHIRNGARILIDLDMPGLALALIAEAEPRDTEAVMALQKARALRSLKRVNEAVTTLEQGEGRTKDAKYRQQLRTYRINLMEG